MTEDTGNTKTHSLNRQDGYDAGVKRKLRKRLERDPEADKTFEMKAQQGRKRIAAEFPPETPTIDVGTTDDIIWDALREDAEAPIVRQERRADVVLDMKMGADPFDDFRDEVDHEGRPTKGAFAKAPEPIKRRAAQLLKQQKDKVRGRRGA